MTKKTVRERLLAKIAVNTETGCWEWTGTKKSGYGQIWYQGDERAAHRLSYEIHCGPITNGLHCLHRCDNRACVNPDHLFLGTNLDNIADMVSKGRQQRRPGTSHARARLTEADVIAIRSAEGITQRKLAKMFGISLTQISAIKLRKRWQSLR